MPVDAKDWWYDKPNAPQHQHKAMKGVALPHMRHKCQKCGHGGRAKITTWLGKRWWTCIMCLHMQGYP